MNGDPSYFAILQPQLIEDEGRVNHAYHDSLGFITIGVGHLIDQRKGGKISDAAINLIFREDCLEDDSAARQCYHGFDMLTDRRKAALANMAHQLGEAGLSHFTGMLAAIKAEDWQAAHDAMLDSIWAKQTPARAQRLAKAMLEG